jgi:hypothetical protein
MTYHEYRDDCRELRDEYLDGGLHLARGRKISSHRYPLSSDVDLIYCRYVSEEYPVFDACLLQRLKVPSDLVVDSSAFACQSVVDCGSPYRCLEFCRDIRSW